MKLIEMGMIEGENLVTRDVPIDMDIQVGLKDLLADALKKRTKEGERDGIFKEILQIHVCQILCVELRITIHGGRMVPAKGSDEFIGRRAIPPSAPRPIFPNDSLILPRQRGKMSRIP